MSPHLGDPLLVSTWLEALPSIMMWSLQIFKYYGLWIIAVVAIHFTRPCVWCALKIRVVSRKCVPFCILASVAVSPLIEGEWDDPEHMPLSSSLCNPSLASLLLPFAKSWSHVGVPCTAVSIVSRGLSKAWSLLSRTWLHALSLSLNTHVHTHTQMRAHIHTLSSSLRQGPLLVWC